MEEILTKEEILQLVKLPKNFDSNLVDLDFGFESKIFPHISKEIFTLLKSSQPEIYKNLAKAGVLYSFVLDIPKIKVHISNYGINQFEQNKTRTAPWWDVRDLGLSWLKKADFYLTTSLQALGKDAEIKEQLPFFRNQFPLVDFWQFNNYYSLNNSVDAYSIISELMKQALEDFKQIFPNCDIEVFMADEKLRQRIISYLIDKAIAAATENSNLTFISSGIVVQYEELPWQKSVVISNDVLEKMGSQYSKGADSVLKYIYDYLNLNNEKFPCFALGDARTTTKIIVKKSGLFL